MQITYRQAQVSDVELVITIYNQSFYADFVKYGECPAYGRTPERMKSSIEKTPKDIILCDEIPVGVVSIEQKEYGLYEIGCLCIIPEFQHRGIGQEAIQHILEKYPDWMEIQLITPADKEENIRFYTKKCGFQILKKEMDGNVQVVRFSLKRLVFESDYIEGAHEEILKKLSSTNFEKLSGYGLDRYCEAAKKKIKEACGCPKAEVSFLVGGTQTNQIVIDSLLKSYEGVVAAQTGHVSSHEAGAIEYTGHKVLTLPAENGKLKAETLRNYLQSFYADENHDHMVFPGMVYISHPTEYGTLYTKAELETLSHLCKEYHIPLYMDGARLGYGIMSHGTDVTLSDIAKLCDAFYIGGTKVGALCGEAVVFTGQYAPAHFMTRVKQHGALLAKGRLLGIQFDTLFTDDLYVKISRHAIEMAERLKKAFREKGYTFFLESPANQIFITLDQEQLNKLNARVSFSIWEKLDENHTVVRFATSWATREEDVEALIQLL